MALEGIRQLQGLQETTPLRNLVTLKHLAFGIDFNESLEGVAWFSGLQSLSFGKLLAQRPSKPFFWQVVQPESGRYGLAQRP